MTNILREFFRGRIPGWEPRASRNAEESSINHKIEAEKKYFSETMSAEDFKRLEKLEDMYIAAHFFSSERTYSHAFMLGVMLMCAVFSEYCEVTGK